MSSLAGRRISEDLRYELVEAARAAETSNRPRSLLVLATLLFLVAGVGLIAAVRERDGAVRQFQVQTDRVALMEDLRRQFEAVQRLDTGAGQANERMHDLFTRVEQAASEAGLQSKPAIPDDRQSQERGATRHLYIYRMTDPSLEALLRWVEESKRLVPGLEVSLLEIVPEAKTWRFNVGFVRWERSS